MEYLSLLPITLIYVGLTIHSIRYFYSKDENSDLFAMIWVGLTLGGCMILPFIFIK